MNAKNGRPWLIATHLAAAGLCLLALRWQVLNRAPPAWDESGYLLQATTLYDAWHSDGWAGFAHQFLRYDPGKVGFVTVLVQPFFARFGPSLRVAMVPYALAWFVAAWAIVAITRETAAANFRLPAGRAAAASFLAFLLFAALPLTSALAQSYLVEFPLAVLAMATIACVLNYRASQHASWLVGSGFAAGCGMLTKVTFPVFILPALLIHLATVMSMKRRSQRLAAIMVPAVVAAAVCGKFYATNYQPLYRATQFLSSQALAQSYGRADALDPTALFGFLGIFVSSYELALYLGAATLFVVIVLLRHPRDRDVRAGVLYFAVWFLVPVLIVGLSPFKDERYFYPCEVSIAVLAGFMLSAVLGCRPGRVLVAALFLIPATKLAVVNGMSVPSAFTKRLTILAAAPDPDDHQTEAEVNAIADTLATGDERQRAARKTVILLSATNRYCQGSLLRYIALRDHIPLNFIFLPAFAEPDMTPQRAVDFLDSTPHRAVLYNAGHTFPPRFAALDAAVAKTLASDSSYGQVKVPFWNPDGCAFEMFVRKLDPLAVLGRAQAAELSGARLLASPAQFGGQYEVSVFAVTAGTGEKVFLKWKALVPLDLSRTVFVHVLDGHKRIIAQLDHPQAGEDEHVATGAEWFDRMTLSAQDLQQASALGVGIYNRAPAEDQFVAVTQGPSDSHGHRLLIPLPALR